MNLILASKSPRRRDILRGAGYSFDIIVSEADESIDEGLPPAEIAQSLAERKALAVKKMLDINSAIKKFAEGETDTPHSSLLIPNSCAVLGADTIVVLGGKILGKPADAADAHRMLRALSGQTHTVYTGVHIKGPQNSLSFCEATRVEFYELAEEEIGRYIATGEPFDKAGAYGVQARGCVFVRRIEGDYFNVCGLPIARTARELKGFGIFPD